MRFPSILRTATTLLAATGVLAGAQEPERLDTVRVEVASRAAPAIVAAQRSVQVIGRESIDRSAARSVSDLLATAVGADLASRSPAQADLAFRGSSLGQVLVLVDGVRVSDLQTAHFDLDLVVPLDAVERIEILRGPGATLYGPDAIGAVVNIVTRQMEPWTRAQLSAGSFGTTGAAIGGARRAGGTWLRAAADAERSRGHRDGTDYEVVQAAIGAERELGPGRIAADAGIGARNFGAADFYAPAPSYERTRSQTATVRYAAPVGGWSLDAAASIRRHSDDFILRRADPAFYRNRHTSWQSGIEVGARGTLGDRAHVAAGIDVLDAQLESARLGNRREQRASGFAEATIGNAAAANGSVGVRVDRGTSIGTFASPSLGISIPLHRVIRARASVSRGLRAPSWTDRYYRDPANVADSTVGPERFWVAEAGARIVPRWGAFDVAAYVRRATGLIDWVRAPGAPATTPWVTANLETATYRGLEAVLSTPQVAGADVTLHGSFIGFDAEVRAGTIGKYALRPLHRVLGATVSKPLGAMRWTMDARHAQRVGEDAYLDADIRMAMPVGAVDLRVDVTNVLGADYLDASAKPVAGRAVTIGLVIQ